MSIVPLGQWLAHRPRRGVAPIDTIVLHASEHEDISELIILLRARDRSYHYIIERDGTVCKAVPFSAVAFHSGNSYGPHEAARGISYERDASGAFVEHTCVNEYSVGICLINRNTGSDPYANAQVSACTNLIRDLKTPLPKLKYLTTHAFIAPGRSTDPAGLDVISMSRDVDLELWFPEAVLA